jgi:hypothetical protein
MLADSRKRRVSAGAATRPQALRFVEAPLAPAALTPVAFGCVEAGLG